MLLELGPQLSQYLPVDGVLRSAEFAKTVQLIGERWYLINEDNKRRQYAATISRYMR